MTHRITYAGLTGPGLSHDHNEDAVVLPGACFTGQREFAGSFSGAEWGMAVLDGMGGNNGGETASAEVARTLAGWSDWSPPAVAVGLQQCNRALFDLGRREPTLAGLGATIAGLALSAAGLHAFNVGDARVHRWSGGFLQPLTKDDSLHQVLLDAGQAQGDRAATQHTILQCLGGRHEFVEIEPHLYPVRLRSAARFVVCSDGITDMLDLDAMEAALQGREDGAGAARALYAAALAAGGKDNLSVVVVDIDPEPAPVA